MIRVCTVLLAGVLAFVPGDRRDLPAPAAPAVVMISLQEIADPRLVEFDPSADHFSLNPDGTPIVSGYAMAIATYGSPQPFEVIDLGKPAPESDGKIRVAFLGLLNPPLTPGVVYEARVSAIGPGGSATSDVSNPFSLTPPPPPLTCPPPAVGEFTGCYYSGMNFDTLAAARIDAGIAFDWGTSSPDPMLPADQFSARWEGVFQFTAGTYVFTDSSDDGIRVLVDGAIVVDRWTARAATTDIAQVDLAAGAHTVRVEYYEAFGSASVFVTWALVPPPPPPPSPIDCVVSDWTCSASWSLCAADGTQTRTCSRSILTPAANGGVACPTDLTKTETQACTPPPPPGDTTAPTISAFTIARSGKSANYTLTVTATDNISVTRVTFALDGRSEAPMVLLSSGTWSATLKVTTGGTHTITVHAFDAAGNSGSAVKTFVR